MVIFLAMIIYFVLFEFVFSEDFVSSRSNSLQDLMAEYVVRGDIISADGETLATTYVAEDGSETRIYPYGNLFAHAVGYMINGKLGIENQANFKLLTSHQFFLTRIRNNLNHVKSIGDDVHTTLRYDLQSLAYQGLGSFDGAVVALDPSTGEVLAMVSKPDFDPNTLADIWDTITTNGSDVLYNNVTQGQFAPGSTFKIFTLLEYYKENKNTYQNYTYDCTSSITVGEDTIHCAGNKAHGEENLMQSFSNSCNCSFSNIALSLNADSFQKTCESLLFNHSMPGKLQSNRNYFHLTSTDNTGLVMQTGIGQGDTLVTPLYMAMIAGAIANDGVLMKPYDIDYTENAAGTVVKRTRASSYGKILQADEVSFLRTYLSDVVEEGTAQALLTDSYQVYGKTGSAQTTSSLSVTNAWFVGYATNGSKQIAVAVLVENAGAGSTYAVPIAKLLFDSYLQ